MAGYLSDKRSGMREVDMRGIFTMRKVAKSNHLKKKTCDRCVERLKGILSAEQIREFQEAFYEASDGYLFSERKG